MKLPSPSTAIATVALVAAFGGTATAASLVTGKNIKNASVTGKDIKNRSLSASDLSKKARSSLKGNAGPAGPQGVAGPKGETGAPGPAVLPSVYHKTLDSKNLNADDEETILSFAPPTGQYVINAKVLMFENGTGMGQCDLLRGGSSIDTVQINPGGATQRTPMSLQAVSTLGPDIAKSLKLNCSIDGSSGSVSKVKLTLIPVGSVKG